MEKETKFPAQLNVYGQGENDVLTVLHSPIEVELWPNGCLIATYRLVKVQKVVKTATLVDA